MVLKCEECDQASDEKARNWRTFVAWDPRDDEPAYVVTYCPLCAEREFGSLRASSASYDG